MNRIGFIILISVAFLLIILAFYNYYNKEKEEIRERINDSPSFNPCQMGCLQLLQKNGVCTNQNIKDINAGLDASAGEECLFSYIGCNVQNCCTTECKEECPSSIDQDQENQTNSLNILQNLVYLLDEFPYIAFA